MPHTSRLDERPARILIVEDNAAMGALLIAGLSKRSLVATHVTNARDALAAVESEDFAAIVSDIRLGGTSGLELCARLDESRSDVPVILITGFGDMETAIAAIRAGAHDFLPKPFEVEELAVRVRRAAELFFLRNEVRRLRAGMIGPMRFAEMIGESPAMQRVFATVERVATSSAPVLIEGETGTGKELLARAIHARSARCDGPFVVANCSTFSDAVFGASNDSAALGDPNAMPMLEPARALLRDAHDGTLFLDEIGEMPQAVQANLVRALANRGIHPGGGREFNARIVCATHRDLGARVEAKLFRDDLYYRLNVLPIRLPPLRQRGSDILALANAYLREEAHRYEIQPREIEPEAARLLLQYAWPGNVRELFNVMERALALAQFDRVRAVDLPDKIRHFAPSDVLVASRDPSELVSLEEVERRYILRVIEAVGGHRSRAAEVLKVDRKTLYSKLKQYGRRTGEGS